MPVQKCSKDGKSGYRWGESGVCFTGSDAKERAEAVGKAIHSQDSGFISDKGNSVKWKIDETSGFLTAPVVLARTGVQTYFGFELGLKDRALEKINVYRGPDEVFQPEAMSSYQNLVITDDHPNQAVTVDNVKELQKGNVSNVRIEGNFAKGILTVTDKQQIEKIQGGKKEVSLGYSQDLQPCGKTVDGLFCEFQQTNIRGNHLAIVDAGRCGGACRILNDSKIGDELADIVINGITYTSDDGQLVQAVKKFINDAEEEKKGMEKQLEKEKEEKDKAVEEKEKAEAEKEASKKSEMKDEDLQKLINDRAIAKAALIAEASAILGDKMPNCVDCDMEIMKAVIGDKWNEEDVKGKSDAYKVAYTDALYKIALKDHKAAKKSLSNLGEEILKDKDGKEITRDAARKNYMKTLGQGVTV